MPNELDDDIGASAISLGLTGEAGLTFNSQTALKSVRKSACFYLPTSQKKSPDNDRTLSARSSSSTDFNKFANIRKLYTKETPVYDSTDHLKLCL